ncbi:hypothetical protein ACT691_17975 [Vibrio metschnikovii]
MPFAAHKNQNHYQAPNLVRIVAVLADCRRIGKNSIVVFNGVMRRFQMSEYLVDSKTTKVWPSSSNRLWAFRYVHKALILDAMQSIKLPIMQSHPNDKRLNNPLIAGLRAGAASASVALFIDYFRVANMLSNTIW